MKTSLLFLFIVMSCNSLNAQYRRQYFDGADTITSSALIIQLDTASSNVWQIGKPQKHIFDSAATFPNVLITDTLNPYPANNLSRFYFKYVPPFREGIMALRWKQKLDMDENKDGGTIDYSLDQGNTWVSVFNDPYVYNFYGFTPSNVDTLASGEVAFSGTDSTWKDIWLCFDYSLLFQADSVLFRFTLQSDSLDNDREGWMIDNMSIHLTAIHTAISKIEQKEYVKIYPNPSLGIVNIEIKKQQEFHLIEHMELIDVNGQIVGRWKNCPTKFFINTTAYKNGIYYLKIKTNLRSAIVPLIIRNN